MVLNYELCGEFYQNSNRWIVKIKTCQIKDVKIQIGPLNSLKNHFGLAQKNPFWPIKVGLNQFKKPTNNMLPDRLITELPDLSENFETNGPRKSVG